MSTKQGCVHRSSKVCCQTLKHFGNVFVRGGNNIVKVFKRHKMTSNYGGHSPMYPLPISSGVGDLGEGGISTTGHMGSILYYKSPRFLVGFVLLGLYFMCNVCRFGKPNTLNLWEQPNQKA